MLGVYEADILSVKNEITTVYFRTQALFQDHDCSYSSYTTKENSLTLF